MGLSFLLCLCVYIHNNSCCRGSGFGFGFGFEFGFGVRGSGFGFEFGFGVRGSGFGIWLVFDNQDISVSVPWAEHSQLAFFAAICFGNLYKTLRRIFQQRIDLIQ